MGKNGKPTAQIPAKSGPSLLFRMLPSLLFFGGSTFVLSGIYNKYGLKIFLSQSSKQLSLSPSEWAQILPSKTLLMIGGPHRGGTTVIWNELRKHPDVANFGSTFESGVDYSEGVFLQSVYPRFGVGEEYQYLSSSVGTNAGKVRENGLGRYALAPEEAVHWTEASASVTEENQASILNSWGYHWNNISKPVWIEKSPPNLHMGRYFNALFNLGLGNSFDLHRSGSAAVVSPPPPSLGVVRFLFITRHPLANALSHKALEECKHMSVASLVEHWVVAHEYAHTDKAFFAKATEKAGVGGPAVLVKQLTLEGFAVEPARHLEDVWRWLGLAVGGVDEEVAGDGSPKSAAGATARSVLAGVAKHVRPNPNAKYRGKYCRSALASPKAASAHRELVETLGDRVEALGLGYTLDDWPCLAATVNLAQKFGGGVQTPASATTSNPAYDIEL